MVQRPLSPLVRYASGGFASAAERTKNVQFGTANTCPMFRYNPAIVAQAFATLGSMYPGRIFLTVGTGEAMNEFRSATIGRFFRNESNVSKRLSELSNSYGIKIG